MSERDEMQARAETAPATKPNVKKLARAIERAKRTDGYGLNAAEVLTLAIAAEKYAMTERSVLQIWVAMIPLRAQGTLLTCVRGCDLTPKYPLDSLERQLVAALRWSFMVPADAREVDAEPGCFFRSEIPVNFKPSALGHYPQHWISHVMHGAEVLAIYHPNRYIADKWRDVYLTLCKSLHVNPETPAQADARYTEDRVQAGNIVG